MGRHSITIAPDVEASVDDYRASQRPLPDFNEAVNTLLRKALKALREEGLHFGPEPWVKMQKCIKKTS